MRNEFGQAHAVDVPRPTCFLSDSMRARVATSFRSVLRDTSGVAMTEYVILVGTVALTSVAAFILLGVAFVQDFNLVRALLLLPFP
jgi:Flp pilus assembly pilin Flp